MNNNLRSPSPFCPHFASKEWEEIKDDSNHTVKVICHGCSNRPWEVAKAMESGV